MFGYVVVNKSELKFKEYDQYRRYYCGLCRLLKKKYGRIGQMALSYDMTFLVLLLTGLYESDSVTGVKRCIAHPWKKQEFLYNGCTEYAADMTVLLTYYKCLDDFKDEKKWFCRLYAKRLERPVSKIREAYPEKTQYIEGAMRDFSEKEAQDFKEPVCLDILSDAFGKVLSGVFSFTPSEKETIWLDGLEEIGYAIGKFIYITDAYDDLERDKKKHCFNPLLKSSLQGEKLDDWLLDVLRGVIAKGAQQFEKLPILQDVGILRNIMYSGIFSRFYQVREMRRNKEKKQK